MPRVSQGQNQIDLFSGNRFPLGLPEVFKRIHYYLYTNSNMPRAERLGAEMTRILFCKIYDELHNEESCKFRVSPGEKACQVSNRIRRLFEEVRERFPDVFDAEEQLHLDDKSILHVAGQLGNYRLLDTGRDTVSEAFQAFWGPGLRGEKGQFFTPKNVVKLCVDVLGPKPGERIIDPACGLGGFLIECVMCLGDARAPGKVFGIDKEVDLAKICRAYMSILACEDANVFCADSLDVSSWDARMKEHMKDGTFDLVLTNPPFGGRISVEDVDLLRHYALGHKWVRGTQGKWRKTNAASKQVPQVLFIERCLQLLRPGGRMAIVLPDGVFGNPSDRYVLQYVLEEARILGIVSLAPETFLPSTHTKTSVLFLRKKKAREGGADYSIFMALAKSVGHDKNGKAAYKMDEKGEYLLDEQGRKVLDDDLPEIARRHGRLRAKKLDSQNHLSFVIKLSELRDSILVPNYYNPEIDRTLSKMGESGRWILATVGELVNEGVLSLKRGNEVGSQYYGMGPIPFVRTSDIVNWEIKIDPIKSIPREVYERYAKSQNIEANDVLIVTDGTFLIGRTALVTSHDKEMVIQSHIRRIRCLKPQRLHPYLLLYLLNTGVVQEQIRAKTFVQATISTLGNRIYEIVLPIPEKQELIGRIVKEVSEIIDMKVRAKRKMEALGNLHVGL